MYNSGIASWLVQVETIAQSHKNNVDLFTLKLNSAMDHTTKLSDLMGLLE